LGLNLAPRQRKRDYACRLALEKLIIPELPHLIREVKR
jgi:hypothetical protein